MGKKADKDMRAILIKQLMSLLLLLPFLTPESIQWLSPAFDSFCELWVSLAAFIVLIVYVIRGRWSPVVIAISIYQVITLAATIINAGAIMVTIKNTVMVVGLCMLIDLQLNTQPGRFLKLFLWVLATMVVANLLSVILYPDGIYRSEFYSRNWLLGYKNVQTLYIFPLLAVWGGVCDESQMEILSKSNMRSVIHGFSLPYRRQRVGNCKRDTVACFMAFLRKISIFQAIDGEPYFAFSHGVFFVHCGFPFAKIS